MNVCECVCVRNDRFKNKEKNPSIYARLTMTATTQNNSKIIYQNSISLWILHIEKVKPFFSLLIIQLHIRNDGMNDGNQTNFVVVFELNHHNYEQINNIFYNLYSIYMWEKKINGWNFNERTEIFAGDGAWRGNNLNLLAYLNKSTTI